MSDYYQFLSRQRLAEKAAMGLFGAARLFAGWGGWQWHNRDHFIDARARIPSPALPAAPARSAANWRIDVFDKRPMAPANHQPKLAQRYRLAGTFFAGNAAQFSKKAIIDDLQQKDQKMLGEGEKLSETPEIIVAAIHDDDVILRSGSYEEKLTLSFMGGISGIARVKAKTSGTTDEDAAMLARFGSRVEDRRWVLKRDALLEYYQELMRDTERLAKVFASLKPLYQNSRISGYVLDIEAEKPMFHAFGLRQNDVIRKVNSMPMTSRNRAEYFIREFVNNRANGFVLDIERDGKPLRQIYLVR